MLALSCRLDSYLDNHYWITPTGFTSERQRHKCLKGTTTEDRRPFKSKHSPISLTLWVGTVDYDGQVNRFLWMHGGTASKLLTTRDCWDNSLPCTNPVTTSRSYLTWPDYQPVRYHVRLIPTREPTDIKSIIPRHSEYDAVCLVAITNSNGLQSYTGWSC
jgi:hypothetical protein